MKHITKFSQYLIKEELTSTNHERDILQIIGEGDVTKLDRYIDEHDVDPNTNSGTFLVIAAKQGKLDIVKYLAETGGDFKIRRNKPLKMALEYGNIEVAKFILDEFEFSEEEISDIVEYIKSSNTISGPERRKALQLLS